ncbi:MAG: group 1 truncated hemoglobin [Pseudomonadota bacterium]
MDTKNTPSSSRRGSATLLDELGGEGALDALVGAFYFNVLQDPRIAHFFANTDVDAIRHHQRLFLEFALGGENRYRGRPLGEAHRRLIEEHELNGSHFDAIVELLAATLTNLGYGRGLTDRVTHRVASLREAVLGQPD